MINETPTTETLTITRDGEVTSEFEPKLVARSMSHVQAVVAGSVRELRLQFRMARFDALHGTNYRMIRNQLKAQQRRERFAQSVGLVSLSGRY